MAELKNKLGNEDLIKVLKFCQENNVEIKFDCSKGTVNMKVYGTDDAYDYIFFEDDLEELRQNVADMFLKRAARKLHPEVDPDIYNCSGGNHVVCYDYLDGDEKYRYVVMSIEGCYPTVYIQFPGVEKIESYYDIITPEVHGGFTFLGELASLPGTGIWLGWDYAHCGDYIFLNWNLDPRNHIWTKKELVDAAVSALTQIRDTGLILKTVIGRAE